MGKEYFPNNWQHWKDAPDGWADDNLPTFEEFMDYRVGGWAIQSSHTHLIRAYNKTTGKVKEFKYKQPGAAFNKIEQLVLENNYDICMVDEETVRFYRNTTHD